MLVDVAFDASVCYELSIAYTDGIEISTGLCEYKFPPNSSLRITRHDDTIRIKVDTGSNGLRKASREAV